MSDKEMKEKAEELNDEELGEVSGGVQVQVAQRTVQSGLIQSKMPSPDRAQNPVKPSTMPRTVKK